MESFLSKKNSPIVGLVGCGTWGQKILRDLVSLSAEVWVIDPSSHNQEKARELGAARTFTQLPQSELPQGWIVATPAATHFQVAMALFESRLPIYIEKPLTCSYAEAKELAEKAPCPVFVMHNWRYHGGIQLLASLAKSKELGELVFMKSNRCNWTSPRSDVDSVWTLIPHDITIAYSVLGNFPEPKAAVVENYNGIQRGMTAFLGQDPPCVMEVSNRYGDKRREVRLHFTKGVAVLKNETVDHLEIYHGDDQSKPETLRLEIRNFATTPPLLAELKDFISFLSGGKAPLTDLWEGAEVIRIIEQLKTLAIQA